VSVAGVCARAASVIATTPATANAFTSHEDLRPGCATVSREFPRAEAGDGQGTPVEQAAEWQRVKLNLSAEAKGNLSENLLIRINNNPLASKHATQAQNQQRMI
jgi:hypothetical protein